MNETNKKCLIAYFSRKGQNYVSGRLVDLKVGNTEVVASMIQKITNGVLFHIESVTAYPKYYTEATEVANWQERTTVERDRLRPESSLVSSKGVRTG